MQEQPHKHSHEHRHEQDERPAGKGMSRRGFIGMALAGLGVIAISQHEYISETLLGEAPLQTLSVDPATLHKPKQHYCRLKVYKSKLIFEKSCCVPLDYQGEGKVIGKDPLRVELPKVTGPVNIDVQTGNQIVRYLFQT